MAEATLTDGRTAVRVRSESAPTLGWLVEFSCPPFSTTDAPPQATIDLVFGPERCEALRARGREGGPDVACFTLDGGHERYPLWLEEDGWEVLRDGAAESIYIAARGGSDGRPLEVAITAPDDSSRGRLRLLRAVREVISARALADGLVQIHGSAAADALGRTTVVVGLKGAGKSSLLVHALGRPGIRYVTNDRALVDGRPEMPVLRGIPTIARLRQGTLDLFPSLARSLEAARFDRMRTLAESAIEAAARTRAGVAPIADRPGEPQGARLPSISPAQLRRVLGVDGLAGGPLRAIVFPRIDPSVGAFEIGRLAAPDAARLLAREGLLAGGTIAAFLARPAPPPLDAAALEARLASICSRVACLSCAMGPRAYEDPPVWAAIERAADER